MQHSPHEGFKDTLSHLMRNKPLFYTLIVAFAAVLYLVYKHSQAAAGTNTPGTTSAQGTPSSISNTYVTVNKTAPGGVSHITPVPPGGPPPKPKPPLPDPRHPVGADPWLSAPPPGQSAASWNPYQYSNTPKSQQWLRPKWYTQKYGG